ncbi:MAG: methyl-accepting chemotaxis protein, partial [Euryarchaeota archaeon]|nr:methyl-accepting chemotaxis protein [Euryarchaeota archaeon]
ISFKLDATNDLSTKMDDVAKIGAEKAKSTEQSLDGMQASMGEAYENMAQIFQEMQHISGIAKEIRSFADTTNILSLNAALEAGRAGAFGESFGIIADEVKSLAEESFNAAQEIANIIQKLKHQSQKADYSMGQAILSVETGSATITETVNIFKEVTEQIIQINEQISDIHRLTEQKSKRFEVIVTHMVHVREKNTNTLDQSVASADMSAETTKAIAELQETTENLTNIIRITQGAIKQLSQNN